MDTNNTIHRAGGAADKAIFYRVLLNLAAFDQDKTN